VGFRLSAAGFQLFIWKEKSNCRRRSRTEEEEEVELKKKKKSTCLVHLCRISQEPLDRAQWMDGWDFKNPAAGQTMRVKGNAGQDPGIIPSSGSLPHSRYSTEREERERKKKRRFQKPNFRSRQMNHIPTYSWRNRGISNFSLFPHSIFRNLRYPQLNGTHVCRRKCRLRANCYWDCNLCTPSNPCHFCSPSNPICSYVICYVQANVRRGTLWFLCKGLFCQWISLSFLCNGSVLVLSSMDFARWTSNWS